ncbi:signal recognition particle protein [Schaalia hyovaginalis]|uniref:signal recognition particle protein n=1 Tax=Schaalia hyovaginalis TaxID=29316 RepID=UPI00139C7573|nr:signal recognition particle protein [Schaalia hyovaginalis]MCF2711070.1 signal recognition particle protein [Schaalia hyovaginalis]MCI6556803.1 signal recognition particle protein [Schaalia hyovaginalis]MCI7512695.1 signal recognition particle protein [Schaalia hyovaginalis]MCI7672495.1 signal recognition particle protein [Schaalia hyovaginalis]MDD7553657.1 signal recognition particle protein [Schaalia hyovaginalis]
MFGNLSDRLTQSFKQLRSRGVLTESDVDQTISEIRRALIDADVALPVVRSFTNAVREKAYGAARSKALNPGQQVIRIVHDELVEVLGGQTRELRFAERGTTVFMLAGLQGAGKTTLAGKLGKWLREEGKSVLLVASDLQRPNAVTQLQVVGERAGVEVWAPEPGNGVGDPVRVARSGLDHAIQSGIDVVIVDTAGRLGVDEELMDQARRIRDAVQPHEIMFVLDAMVGQDAVRTSTAFRDGVGFTGVVLSKLDGDARGGAALSVRGVTGAPILFASTGEGLDDFERFHADRMAGRILDMGDVLTLIEQAEKRLDAEEAERMAAKAMSGELTLGDFLSQLQQIKKLGSMKKMLGMIPGAAQMREQIENFDEKEIDRIEAIVRSMTPAEREDVSILNGSRRARIARGSGTSVAEVNGLVKRFEAAKAMMGQMGAMGGMGPGGFGSLPGRGGKAKQKANARKAQAERQRVKKKARSGNPAKRRAQELEALLPPEQRKSGKQGSAFGAPSAEPAPRPTMDDLPEDVRRMLNGLK